MIPNITRGQSMSGLLVYLAGPGRHNEHTEQHLVAGDPAIMAWHGDAELDRATALSVARTIDQPRRAFNVDVPRGNVWHCSLSIKAEDGQLSDEQWTAIAADFMDEMGFTEASGKSPARWVAVRHGVSQAGNDHIHIAASWVREDGTKMFIRNDYAKSQQTATMLERKYNLQVLESRALGQGTRGYSQADAQISERASRPEPRRVELARKVRAVASGSESEAEFVRRARQLGLLVRPRFAAGRQDVVAGYSVALKPASAERPAWFGGGQLSRDLALPKLRAQWPDTPTGASAAVTEWQAAWRAKRVAAPGRETQQLDPQMWEQRSAEVGALRDRLRAIDPTDYAAWSTAARETAGMFAALSARTEAAPGPLADTARLLSRYCATYARHGQPKPTHRPALSGATMWLLQAQAPDGSVALAIMLRQLTNLLKVLHDAHAARGELVAADEIEQAARVGLASVRRQLPALAGAEPSAADRAVRPDARAPGAPLPSRLGEREQVGRTAASRAAPTEGRRR